MKKTIFLIMGVIILITTLFVISTMYFGVGGRVKTITVKSIEMGTINGRVCQLVKTDDETYNVINSYHPIMFKQGGTYKVKIMSGYPYKAILGGAD